MSSAILPSDLTSVLQVQAMPRIGQQQQSWMGLKRLVVERNAVARDNKVIQLINEHMEKRDPMHRTPLVTLHRSNIAPCAIPPITF